MAKTPLKVVSDRDGSSAAGGNSCDSARLMRVGELAKAVGKTVRAMHLYEELGLLEPDSRSDGGFRLYGLAAVERIHWISKLQAIGFTLAEIQGFVREFQGANSGRQATTQVREVFSQKLTAIREQMTRLRVIENDLLEAIDYLDSCQSCSTEFTPTECHVCDHQGHHRGDAPPLFAGLSTTPGAAAAPGKTSAIDVPLSALFREGNN